MYWVNNMILSENDFNAIWEIFLNKTSPKLSKQLKPVKNLLGSAEHHKKLFIEAVKEYNTIKHVSIPEDLKHDNKLEWFKSLDVCTIINDKWEKIAMDFEHHDTDEYVKYIPDGRIVHFSWVFVDSDFEKEF